MQIHNNPLITPAPVQKVNTKNTSFRAKVNISGAKFDNKVMAALSEKAKRIGSENDVIELRFAKIYSVFDRNNHSNSNINSLVNDMFIEFGQNFEGSFLTKENGKVSEQISIKLLGQHLNEFLKKQEDTANNYLDKLIKTHSNQI